MSLKRLRRSSLLHEEFARDGPPCPASVELKSSEFWHRKFECHQEVASAAHSICVIPNLLQQQCGRLHFFDAAVEAGLGRHHRRTRTGLVAGRPRGRQDATCRCRTRSRDIVWS
ncbi:hypothetical protein B0H12DRAFT_1163234 [Mycena haematopus]|nr:hypothetical protein B0H12DRAFT_1163234 [Mycena haematopus]